MRCCHAYFRHALPPRHAFEMSRHYAAAVPQCLLQLRFRHYCCCRRFDAAACHAIFAAAMIHATLTPRAMMPTTMATLMP